MFLIAPLLQHKDAELRPRHAHSAFTSKSLATQRSQGALLSASISSKLAHPTPRYDLLRSLRTCAECVLTKWNHGRICGQAEAIVRISLVVLLVVYWSIESQITLSCSGCLLREPVSEPSLEQIAIFSTDASLVWGRRAVRCRFNPAVAAG